MLIRSVRSINVIALLSVLACAALVTGCGNNQSNATMPPPGATGSTPKVAATGPAISTTLTFDQLALESAVKKVKNKNGLVFLSFSYADNDGKIYKCELPGAMSKGTYSPEEWVRTFNIYRLPQVIGQKKRGKKGGPEVIGDFPFISPRPRQVEAPTAQPAPTTQPIQMPTLPPMPSQPQSQRMGPRGIPSASPRPSMD